MIPFLLTPAQIEKKNSPQKLFLIEKRTPLIQPVIVSVQVLRNGLSMSAPSFSHPCDPGDYGSFSQRQLQLFSLQS